MRCVTGNVRNISRRREVSGIKKPQDDVTIGW